MRFRILQLLLTATLLPLCVQGQASSPETAKFTGVWRGQFDNLPGVDLVLTDEGGQLHGAILFYFHQRPSATSPYTSTPGLPEPIFDLNIEGQTLQFEVSHRRAHPPASLNDEPRKFHLKLAGPDQAELMNESGGAPVVTMKRTDY